MATVLTGPRKSGRSLLGRIFVRKTDGRLFDDAEDHDEERLFHAWNEAQAARRPLLIIADTPPAGWGIRLPDLRSRLGATPLIEIGGPDDQLLGQLVAKLLADRGLHVPPEVVDFLVPRVERSYVAAQRIVSVLDEAMLSRPRRLTVPMAKQALEDSGLIGRARKSD
jgi:chromosomal replication initiation ATPase DnaA